MRYVTCLKVLLTDGCDIKAVAHAGRTIPAKLRTALEARDPTCIVPGCDAREDLEIDHLIPLAEAARPNWKASAGCAGGTTT
ncbi:MAG: HNH endonuclease [Actinomycetota bacterium]|nr:HNH endonuclease [Actinomycetota bacterium]